MLSLALISCSLLLPLVAGAAPKVNVTLYSESLCPDCIDFITGAWTTVWNTPGVGGVDGIIEWNQVVFGNAKVSKNNATITCQHGPEECSMNTAQACALDLYKGNASAWVPFMICLENAGSNMPSELKSCAATNDLDFAKIDACWKGKEGFQLDLDSGIATNALQPPHEFVPWVTLGGIPGTFCHNSNCDTFLSAVCDAYTGTKPSACP